MKNHNRLNEANAKLCAENAALTEVMHWAQATLTALNVGDVKSGSLLHLKLREVMIAYRAKTQESPNSELRQAAREASDCKLDVPAALPPANG